MKISNMKITIYCVLFSFALTGFVAGLWSKDVSIIEEYKTHIALFSVLLVISVSLFSRMTSR